MMIRQREFYIGSVVRVYDPQHHNGGNAYPLPIGLNDGDTVIVVSFDHGWVTVERDGKQTLVYLINIDSGWDEHVDGRWRPRDHPG